MESSSSSIEVNGVQDIIDYFVNLYSDGQYKVINLANNEQQIDLNGVIGVTVTNIQHLNTGNADDYKATVVISGQYLSAQDVNQHLIYTMFDYIDSCLDDETILNGISNLAGIVKNGGSISSDEETNNCSYSLDLFICKD